MNSKIESIVRSISDIQPNASIALGDLVSDILFKPNQAALVIDHNKQHISLLNRNEKDINSLYRLIISLLAEIKNLSRLSLIYLSTPQSSGFSVFYSGKKDLSFSQDPDIIDLGNGITLSIKENLLLLHDDSTLKGQTYSKEIYDIIAPFFCSRVYPGEGLSDYISNGFCSRELKVATRAYHISIIAIIVAFLLCIVSPLVSNLIGQSTINLDQYNQLLDTIKSLQTTQ